MPGARLLLLRPTGGSRPAGTRTRAAWSRRWPTDGYGTPATLAEFCRGRLHTTGLVAAALAAAATAGVDPLGLDEAADARTPSAALRTVARGSAAN